MFSFYRLQTLSIILLGLLLTACGGGGGGNGSSTAPVAKVVIQQTGLVLSSMGATKQLSAVAYDAQGQVVNAPIRWSSTQLDISVDGTGKVTAASNNGSSQIVAEAESIKSAPLIAIVTTFPVGAVLLTDAQIVGEPVATDPAAEPSFDNTYKVTLTGISAPALADLLINTESKPIVGRVVDVVTVGNQTTVTLAQVSLREAFPNLQINEVIDLSNAEIIYSADMTAGYDIQQNGNSTTFTPKTTAAIAPALVKVTAKSGQPSAKLVTLPGGIVFDCVPTITGDGTNLPITLTVPPAITITRNLSLDAKYTVFNGLERLVLNGDVTGKVEASVGVAVAFEGKVSCEKELYVIRIPVGGPLSLFVGGLVPVKAGFEIGGKVTVATASLGVKAEAKLNSAVGIVCPDGSNCVLTNSLTTTGSAVPVFDLPGIGDLRFEPSVSGFAKVELAIGNPTFTGLRLDTFYLQAGPKLGFSLASQLSQIADTNYQSNYSLQLETKVGLGHKFRDAMKRLGVETISAFEIAEIVEYGKSPTGTVTADRTTFMTGDVINFHVALDAGTVNFIPLLGPYNVSRILLVSNDGPLRTSVIASVNATNGQTVFDIPYTATRAGNVSEFYAFVDTNLLPSADVLTQEVGQAVSKVTSVMVTSAGVTAESDGGYSRVNLVTEGKTSALASSEKQDTVGFIDNQGIYHETTYDVKAHSSQILNGATAMAGELKGLIGGSLNADATCSKITTGTASALDQTGSSTLAYLGFTLPAGRYLFSGNATANGSSTAFFGHGGVSISVNGTASTATDTDETKIIDVSFNTDESSSTTPFSIEINGDVDISLSTYVYCGSFRSDSVGVSVDGSVSFTLTPVN